MTNALAIQRTIGDLIDEYHDKCDAVEDTVKSFSDALSALNMASVIQGHFVETIAPCWNMSPLTIQKNLLKSAWRALYDRLQVDRLASANDKSRFKLFFENPKPFTIEAIREVFGPYFIDPRHHVLRGLAEVFTSLDPAYKSHSKVKIGVKGLPKRVILTNFNAGYGGYGKDRLRDIVNALAAYRGLPLMEWVEFDVLNAAIRHGEDAVLSGGTIKVNGDEKILPPRGITVRVFQNGNAHVFFDADALHCINQALAEFYGDVLPDVESEDVKPSASTAVAKDLQFYWTPDDVADRLVEFAGIYKGMRTSPRVLEPSCGDGRLLDALGRAGVAGVGIEYHAGRAAEARAKGHAVVTANFLESVPEPDFDVVVMNPPFYGRHYLKHIRHAIKFLKPGGVLVSILPATARYDHGDIDAEFPKVKWQDLPVASFSQAGTNVPTVMLKLKKEG